MSAGSKAHAALERIQSTQRELIDFMHDLRDRLAHLRINQEAQGEAIRLLVQRTAPAVEDNLEALESSLTRGGACVDCGRLLDDEDPTLCSACLFPTTAHSPQGPSSSPASLSDLAAAPEDGDGAAPAGKP